MPNDATQEEEGMEEEMLHQQLGEEEKGEQQSPPYMDTMEKIVVIDFLKPLPIHLPTNLVYVYIVRAFKSQGKGLKKFFTTWFHVLHERRIRVGGAQKRGAHGDGVELNIKVYPP